MRGGIVFVGERGNQVDIFLNVLSLLLPLAHVVPALLLVDSLYYLLVLLHDLHQLFLAVAFVQCFLLVHRHPSLS